MRERVSRFFLILSAAILLAAGWLPAQTISGIIAGRVTDKQGKPQAAVAIVVSSEESGLKFTGNSDAQGYYRILEVPPGLYEIRALSSMPTVIHTSVRVDVNRTTAENFILSPEEQRPMPSTAPMTDLYSPTLNSPFTKNQIVEIPVITRDVNNLALLAPGVESVRTFSFASTLVPFSVNGSRGRDNNFIIDSVDNNEPLFGGAATQFTNDEIFQEYSISTGQLKAEFGRNSGATVNAITKSGSNNWHGTLFGFGQDDLFDAMNQVEKQALLSAPEPFYETIAGLTLGGPVKKDKSFFFLSYQWDRLSDNLSDVFPVLSNYPATPADLATLRGLATTPALQAYLATPSVNVVPTVGGITPCFTATPVNNSLGLYQATNPCLVTSTAVNAGQLFGATVPVNFNVFDVPNANTFNLRDHQLSGRFDQKLNDSNDVFFRYLFDDLASPRAPLAAAGVSAFSDTGLLPDWKTDLRQRTQSFLADHRYRSAGGSLNEFRISYSRVFQRQGAFGAPADTLDLPSAIIGDCFAGDGVAPTVGVSTSGCAPMIGANIPGANTIGGLGGQPRLGPTGIETQSGAGVFPSAGDLIQLGLDSSPSRIASNTYQIQDNYSFTRGRHSIKLGVNFAKIDTNTLGMPDDNGFYLFDGVDGYGGFSSFLSEGLGIFGPNVSTADVVSQRLVNVLTNSSGQVIGQGQDELKIKEFQQFYFAQDDWRARNNLTLSFGIRYENYGQPVNSVHDINHSAQFVNTDNKDFAPRLGFAWDPWKDGKTVIRGGYGIQYDPPILNLPLLIWQSAPVSPLLSTDVFGIAQLQPETVYPNKPLTIADLQRTVPELSISNGAVSVVDVSSGMVQGCSLYYDLYNLYAPFVGDPAQAAPFGSRAWNPFAGVNPITGAGTTLPADIPITQCGEQDTVSKNLKNPYVQQWSLGIQRELGPNFLLEVDYVGSKGTRLFQRVEKNPFQGWDENCLQNIYTVYNDFDLGNLAVPGQCRFPRLDDSHGDITEVTNGGSSTYHALQATLTKRYSHLKYFGDVTFTTAYTWSHLIDNASEIFGPGFRTFGSGDLATSQATTTGMGVTSFTGIPVLFDPLANSPVEAITPLAQTYDCTTTCERGNSSFDRRHRFASSFLWDPFAKKGPVLGGWELGGLFTFQSGQPFTPLNASPLSQCADTNGDGSTGNDRPSIGNASLPKNSVALVNLAADPFCLPGSMLSYNIYAKGILTASAVTPAEAATMAHFVQRPLFANTAPPGAAALSASSPSYAGDAGRNSLVGPSTTDLDLSLYKTIGFGQGERYKLQFRWEVYDVLNHPNPGYFNGDPYIGGASAAPAFGFASTRTGAAITGGIPENAIDATNFCSPSPTTTVCKSTGRLSNLTFLSTSTMNTSSRRMQFGLRFIF